MLLLALACLSPMDPSTPPLGPGQQDDPTSPDGVPTAISVDEFLEEHGPELPDAPTDDCPEADVDPWSLNVVVLGDLGAPEAPYTSDFQGAAAVLGDTTTDGFTFAGLGADVALFAGGDVHMGGSALGDIEADGSLGGTGTVDGDVYLGGGLSGVQVVGQVHQAQSSAVSIDLDALADWFEVQSVLAAAASATTQPTDVWGEWVIQTQPGVNVVELTGAQLDEAWGVRIEGPGDLLINVADADVTLDSLVWTHDANVLLNLHGAERVHLSGGDHRVALLAPGAEVTFAHGLLTGHLVAADLLGGGQVNEDPYDGPDLECPEEPVGGPD